MNPVLPDLNRRFLIVDDTRAIHDDFRKILEISANSTALQTAEAALFGDAVRAEDPITFSIDSAYQGEEGLALVQQSMRDQRPYVLAFMDVRMPPGWDGIKTTLKIWEADPHLQIVLCTAYSDYSWHEIREQIGNTDRLLILKKPFDTIEVQQLAVSLAEKFRLRQLAFSKIEDLECMVTVRTQDLQVTNEKVKVSEEQYRLLFERSLLPMFVFDRATLGVLAVNAAAVLHYGYTQDEFLQMTMRDLGSVEGVETLLEFQEQEPEKVLGLQTQFSQTWQHQKKGGAEILVEISWNPLRFQGRPGGAGADQRRHRAAQGAGATRPFAEDGIAL